MMEAVNVAAREAEVAWDGRPSGFQRILPGPVAVLGFWIAVSVLLVKLADRMPSHTRELGFGFSGWSLALYLFLMAQIVFIGVGFIYHRVLTHRACRLHPLALWPLLIASLPAGTPIQWVGNHRHHHGKTDRAADWHSPIHGFWAAHAGWYIYTRNPIVCAIYTCAGPLRMLFDAFWRPQTNQEYARQAKDVAAEPFLAFVSRPTPFAFFVIGQVAVSWCFTYWLWGTSGFLPLFFTQVIYYLIGDGVNSILHMWGDKPFVTRDDSRNFPVLGFMLLGEGYHNAHHAFPRALKAGVLPGQFDTIYQLARVLRALGLCRDIVEIGPREILGKLRDERHRAHFERLLEQSSSAQPTSPD